MRVGVDTFTIRDLKLSPYGVLDYLKAMGFEGAQFGNVRELDESLDFGALRALREYADEKKLYTYASVSSVNPFLFADGFDSLKECLEKEIAAAAAGGWHELRSYMNAGSERYDHAVSWNSHLDGTIKLINALRPTLERYGSRIDIETHGETTFDILRVIESTGAHLTGICFDTANTLVNAEDPVLAAKRAAPYVHSTHIKDAIVVFCDGGMVRQGKAPGMGIVDFEKILPILGEYDKNLPLSIEDHKWLFYAKIFDREWIAKNPDLTPYELGQVVNLAWETQKKLIANKILSVEEYEKTDYMDEMVQRLAFGQKYLNGILKKLDLYG